MMAAPTIRITGAAWRIARAAMSGRPSSTSRANVLGVAWPVADKSAAAIPMVRTPRDVAGFGAGADMTNLFDFK